MIRMENNITGITKLYGIEQLDSLITLPALKPFDIKVCEFLGAVSDILIKDKECKKYPDIITFAFFCRFFLTLQFLPDKTSILKRLVQKNGLVAQNYLF